MKTTSNSPDLTKRIEQLVQEQFAAVRREAEVAVAQAFAAVCAAPPPVQPPRSARRGARTQRRSAEQLEAAAERLHEAVRASPGETMAVLAAGIGASVRELQRPMASLKKAGRVRAVGQRHFTRYFPLFDSDSAAA